MIFGGYGKKSKTRGEVFFLCTDCNALNTFALVENYGYGQLYGVRVAKFKTNRYLLCSHCQNGFSIEKEQWDQAILVADGLKRRGYELTRQQMAESAVELARKAFPDAIPAFRALLWEQLGDTPPIDATDEDLAFAEELLAFESPVEDIKPCPDCAEKVKAAARKCRFCGYRFEPEPGDEEALDLTG